MAISRVQDPAKGPIKTNDLRPSAYGFGGGDPSPSAARKRRSSISLKVMQRLVLGCRDVTATTKYSDTSENDEAITRLANTIVSVGDHAHAEPSLKDGATFGTYRDIVTVVGTRAKDGSRKGNARNVVMSDGKRLFAGSSQTSTP